MPAVPRARHTPRPPNSWIIYRSDKLRELKEGRLCNVDPNMPQTDLSKALSALWKHESNAVRLHYAQRASEAAQLHRLMYPDYRYQPRKREKRRLQMTSKTSSSTDTESLSSPDLSSPIGPHARSSVPITEKSEVNVGMEQHIPFHHSDIPQCSSNDIIAQPPSNTLGLWLFFPDSGIPNHYHAGANPRHTLFPEWDLQEPTIQGDMVSKVVEADTPAQWWPRHQFVGDDDIPTREIPAIPAPPSYCLETGGAVLWPPQ